MPHRLRAWRAWHEACALDLTPHMHREPLCNFVARRYYTYALRYAHRTNHPRIQAEIPSTRDCWHHFETWCAVHQHRTGKRYKDWVFSRGEGELGDVESAVSLLVRDVVRDWLRSEFSDASLRSLSEELLPEGVTLEQLVVGGRPVPVPESMFETCSLVLDSVRESCGRPEQVALVARKHGIPLSRAQVTRASGVGRSALSSRYRSLVERIAYGIRGHFPDVEGSTATQLCLHLLDTLAEQFTAGVLPEIAETVLQEG